MSSFVVSARKYRPAQFNEVVGQEHVTGTLKNALMTDHLAHAFLFCGPRGVGKTTCARILAKTINCKNLTDDHEPCGKCSSCTAFDNNASFNIVELDAASNNSVENIRALIEQVRFQPQSGKYKVFIIDEVHMLSTAAFNAFLKTLEEPPPYAIFILATTEKHKILPTILSRCQIYDFNRISIERMVTHLQHICTEEGITAESEALHVVGEKADGALRDALSIFDRIVSYSGQSITYQDVIKNLNVLDYDYYFRIMEAIVVEDVASVLLIFDEILQNGFEEQVFVNGLNAHLRNLLVAKKQEAIKLMQVGETIKQRYITQGAQVPLSMVLSCLHIASKCDIDYRVARHKRLHVETALIKMCYAARAKKVSTLPLQKKKPSLSQADAPQKKVEGSISKPHQEEKPTLVEEPLKVEVVQEVIKPEIENETVSEKEPIDKPYLQTAKDSLNLSASLLSQVESNVSKELEEEKKKESRLNFENLQVAWDQYKAGLVSETKKANFNVAVIELKEKLLCVRVPRRINETAIKNEAQLLTYLRSELLDNELMIQVDMDESLIPPEELEKEAKPMTTIEKYIKMREINPHIEELVNRFELKPLN